MAVTASEQFADRQTGGLAEDIPTGHVNAAFDIRMSLEGGVHFVIELCDLARVFAQEVRPQFTQSSAYSFAVGRKIERTQRTHFAITNRTRIGLDPDDGAIKDADVFSARPS